MIEASFEAVIPKAINAEFEAIIPREKAFDIVNKDIHIDTNGKYEVKADAGTAMTQVNVEVGVERIDLCEEKDVNFYDYDGVRLYSYWWDEAEKLTELPIPQREHKGLVFDGWNFTLKELKEQGGYAEIGALYKTTDGKTHVEIHPTKDITIRYSQTESNGVIIDWGDGNTYSTDTTGDISVSHTYTTEVKHLIIEVASGQVLLGHGSQRTNFVNFCKELNIGDNNVIINSEGLCGNVLTAVSFSNNTHTLKNKILRDTLLKHINLPRYDVSSIPAVLNGSRLCSLTIPPTSEPTDTFFEGMLFLRKLPVPSNTKHNVVFQNKRMLDRIVVPKNVTNIKYYQNVFIRGSSLNIGCSNSVIPNKDCTSIGPYAFQNIVELKELNIPDNIVTIGNWSFKNCTDLNKVVIGNGLTSIGSWAFENCYSLSLLDFRNSQQIPKLSSTAALTNTHATCQIVVPDNLYDDWIVATNWATYASRIVKASEFVEPTNN